MPNEGNPFDHIGLPVLRDGAAKPKQPPRPSKETVKNKKDFTTHSAYLLKKTQHLNEYWARVRAERTTTGAPELPDEIPLLIQVDTAFNLDVLRTALDFELVSEQEDGFLIVAARNSDFSKLLELIAKFNTETRGGGQAASIHDLGDEEDQLTRLKRILSDDLFAGSAEISDDANYTVDIGVECLGKVRIPNQPERTESDTLATFKKKEERFDVKVTAIYEEWDELKRKREEALDRFVNGYGGALTNIIDGETAFAPARMENVQVRRGNSPITS